ncbi:hypothetical protein BDBG_08790 [Blastomyces gilchristii SLH14081]|uniref:Zn(2)-C6 fungal-type domain-containing protein n=1 Tax=Blastomyces gilchristii (strain SLH14081) TaxID=559298 RepID=A0A179V2S0_BLAGS|nr:uncharacterized protein BDBG_08790 [Blastomyces gilchristii SLH14081]OAT13621.1 hypothetical protein BDBG_08790 [Blastomyces gilchristii SLH14081]
MTTTRSRRYACDRCRAHKLRCNRDLMATTNSPCLRCRKAKADCSIASVVRVGSSADMFPAEMDAVNSTQNGGNGDGLHDPPNHSSTTVQQIWRHAAPDVSDAIHDSQPTSVFWPNLNQSTFLQGQEIFEESMDTTALLLPAVPLSLQEAGPTYSSDFSTNDLGALQSTIFAFHPAHDIIIDQTQNNSKNNIPLRSLSGQEDLFPVISDPNSLVSDISGTPPSNIPTAESGDGENLSPIGLKDACIQKLSDLNATLMKDFHRAEILKHSCTYLFDSPDKVMPEYLHATLEKSVIEEDSVGNMLRGSEQFLEIIRLCKRTAALSLELPPEAYPESKAAHENGLKDPAIEPEISPEERIARRWEVLRAGFHRSKAPPASLLATSSSSSSLLTPPALKLDAPTTLTILSCYTTLLRTYKTLFSILSDFFDSSCAFAEILKLPPLVSALQINGFMIGDNGCLYIKILLETSRHLLNSIQKALDEVLGDKLAQSLLETLLKQDGVALLEDNEAGMKPVRELFSIIEKKLR